jgi:hypothetical protein
MAAGMRFLNATGGVANEIVKDDVRLLGQEPVQGSPCLKVELRRIAGINTTLWRYVVWFDSAHDFWPRRVQCWMDPECRLYEVSPELHEFHAKHPLHEFETTDFASVRDRILGRDRFFPKKVVGTYPGLQRELKVTELTINEEIPAERFVIVPTPGTNVVEGRYSKDPKVKRWVHGGQAAVAAKQRELAAKAAELAKERRDQVQQELTSSASSTVESAPPTGNRLWWWVGGCSALCCVVALISGRFLKGSSG